MIIYIHTFQNVTYLANPPVFDISNYPYFLSSRVVSMSIAHRIVGNVSFVQVTITKSDSLIYG